MLWTSHKPTVIFNKITTKVEKIMLPFPLIIFEIASFSSIIMICVAKPKNNNPSFFWAKVLHLDKGAGCLVELLSAKNIIVKPIYFSICSEYNKNSWWTERARSPSTSWAFYILILLFYVNQVRCKKKKKNNPAAIVLLFCRIFFFFPKFEWTVLNIHIGTYIYVVIPTAF